ncbi:signal peptidase complex subunit 2 [Obelidium mucronatum]|nr:signal peptidase complex subunit 2 [Obelidium mucronatum]
MSAEKNEKPQSAFLEALAKNPVIIKHYNVAEVKHALDGAIRKILVSDFKFKENHSHTDRKLLLGFSSCFFAIGGALYGHFNDFQESKLLVFLCIVLYSILNGGMLLYGMFIEKDIVFVGTRKDDLVRTDPEETVIVRAKCKKATAEYTVSLQLSGKKEVGNKRTASFGEYFDEEGELVGEALVKDVSSLLVDKKSE